MKVQTAFVSAFATTALAAGAADNVNQVLTSIAQGLKELDSAVKSYSGDLGGVSSASDKILKTIESGASSIASGSDLSLTDAVSITTNVQGLQTQLDTTLGDLKGISQQIASSGQCSQMQSQVKAQSGAAQKLQDAITSKAPAETKAIAAQLGGAIGASLSDTMVHYDKVCANAPSGGGSGGAGGSSSSGGSGGAGGHPGGHGGSGSSGSSGGSGSPGGSGSGSSGGAGGKGSGSSTSKPAKTSTIPKPATYTGAASVFTAPMFLAIGAAIAAL